MEKRQSFSETCDELGSSFLPYIQLPLGGVVNLPSSTQRVPRIKLQYGNQ